MRTTQTKAARALAELAEDVAAGNALRASWRHSSKRHTNDGACACDDCEAQPAQPGEPSVLINTAWLDDLATTLCARARELGEWVEAWKDSDSPETLEAYRTLAHELRIAAVRAQRQSEQEYAMMRDAIDRMHAARPGFALVG